MQKIYDNYKFINIKSFVFSVFISIIFFILSLWINFYAGTYATISVSNSVTDLILSHIPVFDVGGIFVYGSIFLCSCILFVLLANPKRIPFSLKTISLFVVVRSLFVTLTHIAPFPNQIVLKSSLIAHFSFGADLFFSGHTGIPFLIALIFWNNKMLRYAFLGASIFFAVIVLMGHLHYSIDVFSAFFITYGIYHMALYLFKKDRLLFK